MSLPRQILPDAVQFVTRRCSQRTFLLTPSPLVNAILLFLLFLCAARHGIVLHAFVAMCNHFHLVLTDRLGRLPRFMQDLDRLSAKVLNIYYGRRESFWAPGSYTAERCTTPEAVLDRMVYAITNPVAAGLVRTSDIWPGLISLPHMLDGSPITATRPKIYFRGSSASAIPQQITGRFVIPPGFEHMTREQFIQLLGKRIEERERMFQKKYRGRFLGVRRVLATCPLDRPKTDEPFATRRPHIAAYGPEDRKKAIAELRQFRSAYYNALTRWKQGDPGALFPAGTYWIRHHTSAPVEPHPARPQVYLC